MDYSAEEFTKYKAQMENYAKYTIEQINLKEGKKEFDLVLDIGSGNGNLTMLLADSINCKKLIGLDIDDKMVEFAKQHHKRDNIDYLQCDVQLPWDQLSDKVKQLEGRCSLIYSSTVLHWISDISQCCVNLRRFLAPDGRIYVIMIPLNKMPAFYQLKGEAKELETAIPLLKPGNFEMTWKSALTDSGLGVEVIDEVEEKWIGPKQFLEKFTVPISYTMLMKHANSSEARQLVEKYKDFLTKNIFDNVTIDKQQKDLCRYNLKLLFIVAKK